MIVALSQSDVSAALYEWALQDLEQRRSLSLPPFGALARVTVAEPHSLTEVSLPKDVHTARDNDAVLVRGPSREKLDEAIGVIKSQLGVAVRVHVDPFRY